MAEGEINSLHQTVLADTDLKVKVKVSFVQLCPTLRGGAYLPFPIQGSQR